MLVSRRPRAASRSYPRRSPAQRKRYWEWSRASFRAPGRGAVPIHAKDRDARWSVLFDVPSNERLHQRLNEWADIIPAHFQVHALIEPKRGTGLSR